MYHGKPAPLRVGLGFLTPHAHSVVESFLMLLNHDGSLHLVNDTTAAADVQFHDHLSVLRRARASNGAMPTVYLRGYEQPGDDASGVDAVLDRPIRLAALQEALQLLRAKAPEHTAASCSVDAQQLLSRLPETAAGTWVRIQTGELLWWCNWHQHLVLGSRLPGTSAFAPLRFEMQFGHKAAGLSEGHPIPMDRWVYWLARHSSGSALIKGDDQTEFRVIGAAVHATDGRDFARLSALFLRATTVEQAVQATRVEPPGVRRFINANVLLGRTELQTERNLAASKLQAASTRGSASTGLFKRLLHRLAGQADARW